VYAMMNFETQILYFSITPFNLHAVMHDYCGRGVHDSSV
jgi:hypothetical protein